jgi:hypothetical protein
MWILFCLVQNWKDSRALQMRQHAGGTVIAGRHERSNPLYIRRMH